MIISAITPSFNQSEFLEECLNSVAGQKGDSLLEHLVLDPGSNDGSLEIARNFPGVTLIHEEDEGQADAVAKGISRARGEIIAWLNSDDYYPDNDVFQDVVSAFQSNPDCEIVYGRGIYVDAQGQKLRDAYINDRPETLPVRLITEVGLLQPALFFKKSLSEKIGLPDKSLQFCMDYDYWIRAMKAGVCFCFLPRNLACARYYPDNKTMGKRGDSYLEICKTAKRHFGYCGVEWLERYAEFLVEGYDGILVNAAKSPDSRNEEILKETLRLTRAFNSDIGALQVLKEKGSQPPYSRTSDFLRKHAFSMEEVCREIPTDQKTVPNYICYTVDKKRWAFLRSWKENAIEKTRKEIESIRANRKTDVCVIVGNGPSLNQSNLELLRHCDVFLSNYVWLKPELRECGTYLSVVNNLVAEQGAEDFNLLRGLKKFFPYWLRYCIGDMDENFFVNSVGYEEFSSDILENISWRSTVSFFQMQLAYGLGYRKVLLIGFDHNYDQDASAVEGDELDCKEDDTNHFDPNYFKNKKWHAADVSKMEQVYFLARDFYAKNGAEIVNCTVGGHLNVFRRGDLNTELQNAMPRKSIFSPPKIDSLIAEHPRLLMIDSTPVGGLSATGQLKDVFLGPWPQNRFLQIWENHKSIPTLHAIRRGESIEESRKSQYEEKELLKICMDFDPDVIYFRAVDYPKLQNFSEMALQTLNKPLVLHIMDDWQERLRETNPELFAAMEPGLLRLISKSTTCLSICDAMSTAYKQRYGKEFVPLANGISLEEYKIEKKDYLDPSQDRPFVIRYMGGLAEDMTYQSVMDLARVVSELSDSIPVRFEIYTMQWFREKAEKGIQGMKSIAILDAVSGEPYRKLLATSDATVIAYNFDERSIRYVRYSIANKMPECLASGSPLIAYGPKEVATIAYLKNAGCALVVDQRNGDQLKDTIRELILSPAVRKGLSKLGREYVEKNLTVGKVQEKFHKIISKAAKTGSKKPGNLLLKPFRPKAKFQTTANYRRLATGRWLFQPKTQADPSHWFFIQSSLCQHSTIQAMSCLCLKASESVPITVSLERHGNEAYEGISETKTLRKGELTGLFLRKEFLHPRAAYRIQLQFPLNYSRDIEFEIQCPLILEIPKFEQPQHPSSLSRLQFANTQFRNGHYLSCLPIYMLLAHESKGKISFYKENMKMALRKVGFPKDELLVENFFQTGDPSIVSLK